jgi:FkbM family methyltransferase
MNSLFLRKVRVALTPRNWLLRTRLANGALVAGYNRAGWGGRGIYIFRDAIEPELESLGYFLRPGSVFVDIGANVGVFSMKAAKEVGDDGIVIAVEPFLETALQITHNINLNKFRNCRVRNLCVAQTTGQIKFYLNNEMPNSFSIFSIHDAESISILGVSLDDLCVWEGLARLDYLKIAAVGAQDMIIAGGTAAIAKFRPIIEVQGKLSHSSIPRGYSQYSRPNVNSNFAKLAPRFLFIPSERVDAVQTAMAQGYIQNP